METRSVVIDRLTHIAQGDLDRVASGYISRDKYVVAHSDSKNQAALDLQLVPIDKPYIKKFDHDEETLRRYNGVLNDGYSFGAFDGSLLVGIVIAEAHDWNKSLWVWEFHVVQTHHKLGIGRRLMERAAEAARQAGLRAIVCETQNTNVNAIQVYCKLGFQIEGVDIPHDSNYEQQNGEIEVFMKRSLA